MSNPQTVDEFRVDLLQALYRGHYECHDDNFDFFHFGFDANPMFVEWDKHVAYLDFVIRNLASFFAAYLTLDDSPSRDLFFRLISFRCLGSPHLKIQDDFSWSVVKQVYDDVVERYEVGPSSIPFSGLFGPLRHFENIPADDQLIALDCWPGSVAYGLGHGKRRQYFYERDGLAIRPERGDYVIDGGACFGDTGVFFACAVGPEGRVYSFDPLPIHVDVIRRNIEQNHLGDRMFVVPKGLGDRTNQAEQIDPALAGFAHPGFSLLSNADAVPVITIDDFVAQERLGRLDFIKLDIEGFELATLKGAAATIAKFRPKLAISLYHKPQDFFEIPLYLKANYPFYRLHLGHHTIHMDETVLYAVAASD